MTDGASPHARSRNFPLNSARVLVLPDSGTLLDTTRMAEGTLTERGLEHRNVQVVMHEVKGGRASGIELRNEDGIFVQIEAELGADPGGRAMSREPSPSSTKSSDDGRERWS